MANEQPQNAAKLDDLLSLFRDYKSDESGGQHAMRGFTFQVWQAVLEVLRAHASADDYAVILEWQQDIAVVNSSTAPTEVRFIQMKKNESALNWSLHALLTPESDSQEAEPAIQPTKGTAEVVEVGKPKPSKARKLSTLAKLYAHRLRFSKLAKSDLAFASNARYLVDIDDDGEKKAMDAVKLLDLPAATVTKIEERLRKQLGVPVADVLDLTGFSLQLVEFPLDSAHKHMVGELVEACALGHIVPPVKAPLIAVFLTASYLRERGGGRSYAKDFETLLKRGVTRADVDSYFVAANDSTVTTEDLLNDIRERLNIEKVDYGLVREMRRSTNRACIDITNRASPVWASVKALFDIYTKNPHYADQPLLGEGMALWAKDFRALNVPNSVLYNNGYLYCLMAMIIENANPIKHLSALPSGAKPKDEE